MQVEFWAFTTHGVVETYHATHKLRQLGIKYKLAKRDRKKYVMTFWATPEQTCAVQIAARS